MTKLDNSIMQEVEYEELRDYWRDFDAGNVAFTMEVNDSMQDDYINDLLNMIGDDI